MSDIQELKELERDFERLEALKKTHPILFFKPIGQQGKFFSSRARNRYLFGSNRSGKSVGGHLELISCAMGFRPWLPKDHPDHIVRLGDGSPIPVPNVGFHLLENLNTSGKQIFLKKMEEWLPKDWGYVKKNNQGQPVEVRFNNGSICHVYSQNMDIDALEGPNGHYFSCDEPPSQNFWNAIKRGLVDSDGISWISATPLKASYFMAELMQKAAEDETHENHELITLSIHDNRKSRGGYLPDRAVDEFIASLPPDEVEARVFGRPKHLAGAVYKEWMPAPPYCVDPFTIPKDWPRIMAIDPAEQKPVAIVWIAISPENKWYVYRECYSHSLKTTKQIANWIKTQEGWEQYPDGRWVQTARSEPVAFRLVDTSARKLERNSGYSFAQGLINENIVVVNADKGDFLGGIDRVRSMLDFDASLEWSQGPQLVVFNTCPRVKYEFMNYVWAPVTSTAKKYGADPKDITLKTNDDMMDGIRYLAVTQATYGGLMNILKQTGFQWL